MSTVAGPHVAAAAAEAAVTALCNENPCAEKVFIIVDDEARRKLKSFPTNNEPKRLVSINKYRSYGVSALMKKNVLFLCCVYYNATISVM